MMLQIGSFVPRSRFSDIRVHQKKGQRILRKLSKNCVFSSPTLNKKPIGRGITPYAHRRRARVCALLPWLTFCWDPCPIDSNIEPLKTVVQELRNELARFQRAACQQKNSLNDIIGSLPAELSSLETNSSAFIKSVLRVVDDPVVPRQVGQYLADCLQGSLSIRPNVSTS